MGIGASERRPRATIHNRSDLVSASSKKRRVGRKTVGRPAHTNSAETRARILDVATERFAIGGFGDTPVDQLADRANVTASTIYYYFGSKAGLYQSAAAQVRARISDEIIEPIIVIVAAQPTLEARLTSLVNMVVHAAKETVTWQRFAFAADLEAQQSDVVKEFRDGLRTDLRRLYAAAAGVSDDEALTSREQEILGCVEMLTLGLWQVSIRPGGLERLPVFISAFWAWIEGSLLGDVPAGATDSSELLGDRDPDSFQNVAGRA